MKKNLNATSIIEAMVVLLIVMIAITWAYNMFSKSVKVTDSNGYKLQAIAIAKEWIEAMTNIRDTNWKVLPWDYANCWNTLNYVTTCHNNIWTATDITHNGSYYIYKDNADYRWKLTSAATWNYSDVNYRNRFHVWLDSDWFYTQSWSATSLRPVFTREIKIEYLEDNIVSGTFSASNEQKMQVTSLVQWVDQSSNNIRKVELISVLTNWRNKK